MDDEGKELLNLLSRYGQEHLLRWWDELSAEERAALRRQILSIDFDLLARLTEQLVKNPPKRAKVELEPVEVIGLPRSEVEEEKRAAIGERELQAGRVAAVTVAGGQGTRLGFDAPKGLFPICPVSGKSLFQLFAERILALRKKFSCSLPWFIMTSETTDKPTRRFFEEKEFFGLPAGDVFFFQQDMLPAVDKDGKCFLDAPHHIFTSPNGHGGLLRALYKGGALERMAERGVENIFCFQVDNVLMKVADPVFIGYHVEGDAEMSTKVVRKRHPEEKLGVVGKKNGRLTVIEYSELSREDMYARNEKGELLYAMGSIATHLFKRSFLERLNESGFALPYHRAEKAVPYINENGELIKPTSKNGIKFETFIFDVLGEAQNVVILEVDRREEFSAVKQPEGEDSVVSARKDLSRLFADWLKWAGVNVPTDENGYPPQPIEISPLFALDKKELAAKIKGAQLDFTRPLLLE